MPRKPTNPSPIFDKKRLRWRVDTPPSISADGKRSRQYFATRDLARDYIAGLDLEKKSPQNVSARDAVILEHATEMLEPIGLNITDAARHIREFLAIFGEGATTNDILIACRKEAARRVAVACSSNVEAAVNAFLASRDGLRSRSVRSYELALKPLTKAYGSRSLAEVTAAEIVDVCRLDVSGASAANRWRCVRAFINYSSKRDWCAADLLSKLDAPRSESQGEILVLTAEEAKALLEAARSHFPLVVAHFALQLFAGIRAEEITKLTVEDVSPGGIDISASAAKKGRRRHIVPNPTLKLWLESFPFTPVANWENIYRAVRRLAGWDLSAQLLTNPPPATRGTWPQNSMRHTYASCAVASGYPLETLLFEFGHATASPALLRQHYVGRVTKSDALKYFDILPPGSAALPLLAVV